MKIKIILNAFDTTGNKSLKFWLLNKIRLLLSNSRAGRNIFQKVFQRTNNYFILTSVCKYRT